MRVPPVACLLLVACGRTETVRPRTPVPPARCALAATRTDIDFGVLEPSQQRTETVSLVDTGNGPCTLSSIEFLPGSDEAFLLVKGPALPFEMSPAESVSLRLTYAPRTARPTERSAILGVGTREDAGVEVQLEGRVDACVLEVQPAAVDFGNVALNTTVRGRVTFTNTGTRTCFVDQLALTPQTDSHFAMEGAEPRSIAPGSSSEVRLSFAGTDSAPPHHREGALTFRSNDIALPRGTVPLSAFVNTLCTEAGQFIYTVDGDGRFSRFDPRTLTYLDIGPLNCPGGSSPFSMNVDQNAVAWVVFGDGNLFAVDTATGACSATSYVPGQNGFFTYGMGSTFDSNTGKDTLFISGLDGSTSQTRLGVLDFPSLTTRFVGTAAVANAELTGTGDGQLWAFVPPNGGLTPTLARLDPATARVLERYELPTITSTGGWAVKFFGGAFFVFIGEDVWKVDRSSLDPAHLNPLRPPVKVLTSFGRDIVGAGVSTCAPVQE